MSCMGIRTFSDTFAVKFWKADRLLLLPSSNTQQGLCCGGGIFPQAIMALNAHRIKSGLHLFGRQGISTRSLCTFACFFLDVHTQASRMKKMKK